MGGKKGTRSGDVLEETVAVFGERMGCTEEGVKNLESLECLPQTVGASEESEVMVALNARRFWDLCSVLRTTPQRGWGEGWGQEERKQGRGEAGKGGGQVRRSSGLEEGFARPPLLFLTCRGIPSLRCSQSGR